MNLVKQRKIQKNKHFSEQNTTDVLALNSEAAMFVNYLIRFADEKNLEKITDEIVKMNLNNRCMFKFLMAIELYVSRIVIVCRVK